MIVEPGASTLVTVTVTIVPSPPPGWVHVTGGLSSGSVIQMVTAEGVVVGGSCLVIVLRVVIGLSATVVVLCGSVITLVWTRGVVTEEVGT